VDAVAPTRPLLAGDPMEDGGTKPRPEPGERAGQQHVVDDDSDLVALS
jgi:hypothetical protein